VAFRSGGRLAWIRADGSGKMEALPPTATGDAYLGSFSPDGKWLVFHQGNPQTGEDLWISAVERRPGFMQLGKPQPLLVHPGQQRRPEISPDGRWLAYYSDESGRDEVYVIPFAPGGEQTGGKWQISNDGGSSPRWSGTELFYLHPDGRLMAALYTVNRDSFHAGEPRDWADKPLRLSATNYDMARDGKRALGLFAVEQSKPDTTHLRVLLNLGGEVNRRGNAGGK
jgi:serine/threonine-protein kinase